MKKIRSKKTEINLKKDGYNFSCNKYPARSHYKFIVLRLGEGCLTDAKFSQQTKWQLLPNRLLPAGRINSRHLNWKRNDLLFKTRNVPNT